MKKCHIMALVLTAAFMPSMAGTLTPSKQTRSVTRLVAEASTRSETAAAATVIVDEDFSGFTEGTEDAPSTTSLLDAMGFISDSTMLKPFAPDCSRTWGGYNLYSAGGCLAVMDGGFVNTPAGDYSGKLTISFRAKLLPGVTTSDRSLDILLCSSKQLVDYKRETITLTADWKTYTMTADNGGFAYTMVQLFTMNDDLSYLVDDFHIEHVINSIVPPEAYDASDLQADGFTARWDTTATAKEYLVSVYTKTPNSTGVFAEEGFEDINASDQGIVDETTPNLPSGWEIVWNGTSGKGGVCREAGYYANGKQSLRLSSNGDYVATPTYRQNFTGFKFWIKGRNNSSDPDAEPSGLIQLSCLTSAGWMPWAYISVSELCKLGKGIVMDRSDKTSVFEELWGVRITYLPAEGDDCEIFLDDISYQVPNADIIDYALFDKVVEGRQTDHLAVSGLDPDKDYYFSVKARNEVYTSAPSEEIEVFDVHQPKALDATDIDIDGNRYTANWTCGKKADYFRVDQVKTVTLTTDADNYVILDEDFSRVTSDKTEDDLENPELGEYTRTYLPIDGYTHIAGWKASSTQKVNGWLGGMEKSSNTGEIAGAIVTPTIDLSHNDGECDVTVRAWGTGGDWLVVRGTNEAAYSAVNFSTTGIVETTVTVPLCNANDNLTFYSNNGLPFLIDRIRVTQHMKAGERVSIVNKSVATTDATTHTVDMTDADLSGNYNVEYKVTAFRYYHGDKSNLWNSKASDAVLVKAYDPTAITGQPTADTDVRAVSGGIAVRLTKAADVRIYTTDGMLVSQNICTDGMTLIPLQRGLYVVKADGHAVKVAVK